LKRNRGYYRYQRKRWIAKRVKQYLKSSPYSNPDGELYRPAGSFSKTDPWDCGNPRCGVCHIVDRGKRSREQREWQAIEDRAW
jgi:hypothetical protein